MKRVAQWKTRNWTEYQKEIPKRNDKKKWQKD